MKKTILALAMAFALTGCASIVNIPEPESAQVVRNTNKEFNTIAAPATGRVAVAVYGFTDKTGQRKPSDKLANISFAVTQGGDAMLIEALKGVGGGSWFTVVERVGLDNLTKERQIIRQARESVGDQKQLPPMMFAGILVEGGIIGYDSNTLTGGAGARYLGIGPYTQYRQDVVTVTLRAVSVQTGEVLLSTSVTKTIISTGTSLTFFRFFDMGTQAAEIELGHTVNEPVNYAVRAAIEQAVVEMIKQGAQKKYWAISGDHKGTIDAVMAPKENKDELVQKNTAPEGTGEKAPAPQQSNSGATSKGNAAEKSTSPRPGTNIEEGKNVKPES